MHLMVRTMIKHELLKNSMHSSLITDFQDFF